MSQRTLNQLKQALQEHFSDEGLVLTDWYLVGAGASFSEGATTCYIHLCSESPFHSLAGMVSMAAKKLDLKLSQALGF